MNIFAALLVTALVAVPPFPWATYSEIGGAAVLGPACEGQAMAYQISADWLVFSTKDRDVFSHQVNEEADFVYFTHGNREDNRIIVKKALPIAEARRQYPSPCAWFTEQSV